MTKKKTPSRLTEALLETADDLHRIGIMDDATYRKITIRHLGAQALRPAVPITGHEIRPTARSNRT